MNGAEIFAFTLREVPAIINRVLSAQGLAVDDVDLFVPHQAHAFILAHLQRKLRIPPERFVNAMAEVAEGEGHHPDFSVHYSTVDVTLWTHAIGGLSENDFIVAAKLDARPESRGA